MVSTEIALLWASHRVVSVPTAADVRACGHSTSLGATGSHTVYLAPMMTTASAVFEVLPFPRFDVTVF